MRPELLRRLVELDSAQRPARAVREEGATYGLEPRDYYRGKQDTLMDVMRWVVGQQAQIGAYLRAHDGPPPTPSVDEAEAAEAILEQLPKSRPRQEPKKRRA